MSRAAGVLLAALILPAAADSLRGEMLRCGALTVPEARLACFDAIAAALQTPADPVRPHASADAPEPKQPTAPPEQPARPQDVFGRDSIPTSRNADGEPNIEALDAVISAVRQRPRGEYVFQLDNGQTWTELSTGRGVYQAGMAVRIERTTLGAYMLSTRGGRATRVRRLE